MPWSLCSVMMMDEFVEMDIQDGSSGCVNPVTNPLSTLALPPQTCDGKHSMSLWIVSKGQPLNELPKPEVSFTVGKPLPLVVSNSTEPLPL